MIKTIQKSKLFIIIIVMGVLTSCVPKKEVVYFQNARSFETIVDTDSFEATFKVNDIVSIYVSTFNLEAVRPFNLVKQTGSSGEEIDYLIDLEGNVDYPVLGKIKLLGLTIQEAKELLKEKLSAGYLKDPVINIRILNFRVTIAGAVNRPGVYSVSGERVSILEALGLAGDLTIKGRRDNILVVRDFKGTKTYTRLDITNKEVFNSPVYYLTQNDYVYVEPNNSAISSATGDARLGTIISISSFVITTALILLTR